MLKNYLTIGLRNLLKNKLFSLINISGMAISIASFLIIVLFVTDELRYDKHIEDADQKYRLYLQSFNDGGATRTMAGVPPMFGPTFVNELPEVESFVRTMNIHSALLFEKGDIRFTERNGIYAESGIADMLSLTVLEGDPAKALDDPNAVALSKTLARKYFGDSPAIGQTLEIADQNTVVALVYDDVPFHSHLQVNYILSMQYIANLVGTRMQSWRWQQLPTYIKVRQGTDAAQLEAKMQALIERYAWPQTKPSGSYYVPYILPVQDIHLYASHISFDNAVKGNAQTVYILSATAVFILVIAMLNFVNLSTARAVSRVKEVGVRKVVGAYRTQLIYQFISESVIIALIALVIGGLITELVLPVLNAFTEKNIPTGIFLNPLMVMGMLVFALFMGAAAGAYPAFYISGYKPAHILSSRETPRSGKMVLRQGLVVLQFILSFFLITASLVVSNQHTYMRSKDLGFNKDNLIVMPLHGTMARDYEATKNEFGNHPNVISTSMQYGLPGDAFAGETIVDPRDNKEWPVSLLLVDHDYVKTLQLTLLAGRDFSRDFPSDSTEAFIITENTARMLGYQTPEEAVNHELEWERWDNRKIKRGKVIGVVADVHLNSLKEDLRPVVLQIFPSDFYYTLSARVKNEDLASTLVHFEAVWKKFNTDWPFEYKFLDDNFDKLYKTEEKLATLFRFFTLFTIFVACLGLFGLVVYSTTQKFKEISIRKVLGAEVASLVVQLTRSYIILIGIAFLFAIPFSYYAANQWLEGFKYRIELSLTLFVKAGLFILTIALVTVGIQSFKAARANPVDALKEQ
jgi:putative ABC transport system permease protein